MRRLLTFPCDGDLLAGSLDEAGGGTGVLLVTGGSQTRIGAHRMYERLAYTLAQHDFPCLRYDRRGVGDSTGGDPGYLDSGPDIAAAAACFRAEIPCLRRVIGFGLCDGATALALHGAGAKLDGIILANPWLVEASSGELAPAAIRSHYRDRLLDGAAWKKLLSGGVDLRKLARSLKKAGGATDSTLAGQVAAALTAAAFPAALILATGDGTAIAAAAELKSSLFDDLFGWRCDLATDAHTFARPGDQGMLAKTVREALAALDPN